jgi:PKD repeat protein
MKIHLLLALSILLSFSSFAQSNLLNPATAGNEEKEPLHFRRCGTVERTAALRSLNPALPSDEEFERYIKKAISSRRLNAARLMAEQVIYIPVVVHIIHQGEGVGQGTNISYEQVVSQIDVLNEDFRRKEGTRGFNEQAVGADVQVEFVLAEIDPAGNKLTEQGIHRVQDADLGVSGALSMEEMDATVKPATYWDPTRYLNIWTADLGEGLLGYAQFPTDSGLEGVDYPGMATAAETDGVVVLYSAFGSSDKGDFSLVYAYDKGRTATHEVGHWLGLRHIWGDGDCSADDYCSDTPVADGPNFGCPTGATSCGSTDMIENYMDYTDDVCMNIFTAQQKERMQVVLENSPRRKELLNSDVIFVEELQADFTADTLEIREGETVSFTGASKGTISSRLWTFAGGSPAGSEEQNPVVMYETAGAYAVSLRVSNEQNEHELVREQYIVVRAANWVNSAPYLLAEVEQQLLQVEEERSLVLDELFADADGHQLSYSLVVENSAVLEAKLNGNLLNMKGLAGGTSLLTITANDNAGGSTEAEIQVVVNTRPEIIAVAGNQLLQVNELRSLLLEEYFTDPDGNDLTYAVFNEGAPVFEAAVSVAKLELKGLSSGTSTLKVVADDGQGGTAEIDFEVEINQQPDILQVPENRWLVLEQDTLMLDLSAVFSDLEGAQLSYAISLSEEGMLAYTFNEEKISFVAHKAGAVNVVLQATDNKQGVSVVDFSLGGHYAPHESRLLAGQEVGMGESIRLNLADYFSDADGDSLTFAVASRNRMFSAEMDGAVMQLSGLALGEGELTIAVTDAKGGKLEKALAVQVVEPLTAGRKLLAGKLLTYPNPFTGSIVIKLEGVKQGRYQVIVSDLQGREVKTAQWYQFSGEGQQDIDLSLLPQGIYLLKVINEYGDLMQRIVKQ